MRIAEIDERRHRVAHRFGLRRCVGATHTVENDGKPGASGRLVFQFGDNARRDLRPDTRRGRHRLLVVKRDRTRKIGRRQRAQHAECDARSDALHAQQQTKPLALAVACETDQADCVVAHLCLDGKRHRSARRRKGGKCSP